MGCGCVVDRAADPCGCGTGRGTAGAAGDGIGDAPRPSSAGACTGTEASAPGVTVVGSLLATWVAVSDQSLKPPSASITSAATAAKTQPRDRTGAVPAFVDRKSTRLNS